ncbi:hypothetical protein [Rhodococcus yananensis]|uniref:hypothetical protein n=1 Tax=Rhodococcus yananensis TaxID=2879464 RepID=UPI001CF80063|nr:hypothetical protein [Rhodococcus yananensis]
MLVVTLVLAAIGFGLLVIALMTGSVVWAWGCIVVCVVGAVLLLSSALAARDAPPARSRGGEADRRRGGEADRRRGGEADRRRGGGSDHRTNDQDSRD